MAEFRDEMQSSRRDSGPQVGIFWDVNGDLIIEGISLDEAEPWGQFRNFPHGHADVWSGYQGTIPVDTEYPEFPRGRVVYDTISERFLLYADICILGNKHLVVRILREFRLPSDTTLNSDGHYRCNRCIRRDP
jgi:hypothetical protein